MNKKHTENVVFPFVSDNNVHCPLSRLPAVGSVRHMSFCLICHLDHTVVVDVMPLSIFLHGWWETCGVDLF
jgi:hypothetical protein